MGYTDLYVFDLDLVERLAFHGAESPEEAARHQRRRDDLVQKDLACYCLGRCAWDPPRQCIVEKMHN